MLTPTRPRTHAEFSHQHAGHCESGVASALLRHSGFDISESMAFGLSSGLAFAYLPFVKLSGLPLIAYRTQPRALIKGLRKPLGVDFSFETFSGPERGQARLDELLAQGHVVGLQTSVYWLPYFPPEMRFHFNAHNLLVYGKEGDEYLISDPVFEAPVRCKVEDLNRSRFAKGVLAPKGLLYMLNRPADQTEVSPAALRKAVAKTCRGMLAPVPIAGVKGMRLLASKFEKLPNADPATADFIGHLVRMQEEIGTGGAGFRFIYAAFLQEAADRAGNNAWADSADRLIEIGDGWRALALSIARMIRARDPMDTGRLAQMLRGQADAEEALFRALAKTTG
ncbi:BtrH N-terminal domain-containing protein [Hydrogenophaga sp. PAMC20947]|uniref:BtrH N-terminal domain-containing protein n=1 Tax=Hydrogenophaga sp. PAMC20947 TaxID=2565558 RepID=UPI00109DB85E|nr:BtrH N-terminal domain-containing protein [Hydrogenophaga sp. PAMC20947]QCB45006.1 DUF4872 domain-containing protein [Hydrogenophaga sp. PAMC20947]